MGRGQAARHGHEGGRGLHGAHTQQLEQQQAAGCSQAQNGAEPVLPIHSRKVSAAPMFGARTAVRRFSPTRARYPVQRLRVREQYKSLLAHATGLHSFGKYLVIDWPWPRLPPQRQRTSRRFASLAQARASQGTASLDRSGGYSTRCSTWRSPPARAFRAKLWLARRCEDRR